MIASTPQGINLGTNLALYDDGQLNFVDEKRACQKYSTSTDYELK